MPDQGRARLGELIAGLTAGLPREQQRLDRRHLAEVDALAPVLRALAERGAPGLARALQPAAPVVARVEVRAGFRFARSRGEERGLEVRLLNLGYRRKYAFSGFEENTLTVVVERVPAGPAERD